MKSGRLLLSNSLIIPDHLAIEIVEVHDSRQTKLHLWRMPDQSSSTAANPKKK